MQNVLGYSALRAGIAFLPVSLFIICSAGFASQMILRIGPSRWPSSAPR